jgi:hypothetical protein
MKSPIRWSATMYELTYLNQQIRFPRRDMLAGLAVWVSLLAGIATLIG